ncbi:hypothetical protein DH2020_047719 [Rehmannia glutinosa]|uniref:Protein kinase domain-containing protein n=1 Tax=Rehmannia glutinosa TaxID=99300 RepID=A0ABR0U8S7_REHGL
MEQVNRSWLRGSCIGRGAYGTVNLGVNISNGAVFAVKSVDLASALPSQVEALENEIRILKSLASPFIVKYLGDDTTTESSCHPATTSFRNLHMEYLPSGTAAAADLATTDFVVASRTWCLVSALSYLHSRGIMHCDVKGKNVLLGPSPGSAKLADFGSAAEILSPLISPRGTPLWMAPEVIRGEHQGPESDVWSLGCTVIEMLTGKPAWGADGYSVRRIGYSDELPLFPARLSSLGLDFLDKCLRRDYTKRWSCDQLLQHPFIAMRSQKNLITSYSSPRCVLDWFNSDYFQEEECEKEEEEGENLDRIKGLVFGAGVNWESDGWLVVRGGLEEDGEGTNNCLETFDLIDKYCLGETSEYSITTGSGRTNSNSNLVLSPEEQSCPHQYDVVSQQCNLPQHFNSSDYVALPRHGTVNVNSLFTFAVFLGIFINPVDPNNSLVSATACAASSTSAKHFVEFHVYSFSSFLFSSLIATALKLAIRTDIDTRGWFHGANREMHSGGGHVNLRVLRGGILASAAGSVLGCAFLAMALVELMQIKLGRKQKMAEETRNISVAFEEIYGVSLKKIS